MPDRACHGITPICPASAQTIPPKVSAVRAVRPSGSRQNAPGRRSPHPPAARYGLAHLAIVARVNCDGRSGRSIFDHTGQEGSTVPTDRFDLPLSTASATARDAYMRGCDLALTLYPGALDAIRHLRKFGLTVILSDGDVVFQPRKIERSGLWAAVEGRVLIYIHKEEMLDAVAERFPARSYVMIDDKLRVLAAMKTVWRDRLTTIFPRQGHYALDPRNLAAYAPADLTIERIGELATFDLAALPGNRAAAQISGKSA